jgi:hypothetical protein
MFKTFAEWLEANGETPLSEQEAFKTQVEWGKAHTPMRRWEGEVKSVHRHGLGYRGWRGPDWTTEMKCEQPRRLRNNCCMLCCVASPSRLPEYYLGLD